MWQVVTSSQSFDLFAEADGGLFGSEIDALLEALTELRPVVSAPQINASNPPQNLLPFKPRNHVVSESGQVVLQSTASSPAVISRLEVPRKVNAPANSPTDLLLPRNVREPLLNLRATVMLAAESEGLRSVLVCPADPQESETVIAAPLSQLLAEYERLKVAYIEVSGEPANDAIRRKVLPIGYTFQIRRTQRFNLYEIASSLGIVRLDDWLRWWSPTIVMQEMRKMFDLVVIQAPAIITSPDVALLAAAVDGVILVATENVTSYASIEAATKRLRAANARILGVAMNPAVAAPSAFSGVKTRVREFLEAIAKGK